MKNTFFDSYHCKSKFHCSSCRDIENNEFRQQIYESFSDVNESNFDCPYGVPWGAEGDSDEVMKEEYDDRHLLNIDLVKSSRELFENIDGIKQIIDEYNEKVKNSKCSPCLRARINRGISRKVVSHIRKNKDLSILNSLNSNLILGDGETDKKVSEWKSDIQNGI